jgi:hypothetical protein
VAACRASRRDDPEVDRIRATETSRSTSDRGHPCQFAQRRQLCGLNILGARNIKFPEQLNGCGMPAVVRSTGPAPAPTVERRPHAAAAI